MPIAFLLFVLIPVAEMFLLIEVGSHIGAIYTIGLVLLTAFIGVNLLRVQGLKTLFDAQRKMSSGALPFNEIGQGVLLAIAGALLLTPGFVTDTIGFSLLVPAVRRRLVTILSARFMASSYAQQHSHTSANDPRQGPVTRGGDIIDAEYEKVDDDTHPPLK